MTNIWPSGEYCSGAILGYCNLQLEHGYREHVRSVGNVGLDEAVGDVLQSSHICHAYTILACTLHCSASGDRVLFQVGPAHLLALTSRDTDSGGIRLVNTNTNTVYANYPGAAAVCFIGL